MSICKIGDGNGGPFDKRYCPFKTVKGGHVDLGARIKCDANRFQGIKYESEVKDCDIAEALKKIAEDPEHYKLIPVPVDAEVIRKDARNYYTDRQAVRCRIEWYEDKEGE